MQDEASGETVWILVVGLGSGHISLGSGTQYFVGDFDGKTFTNRNQPDVELFLDLGRDFYAAQTFSGLRGEPPLAIAWMSNWDYANHTPAGAFRGTMTLPRRLKLVPTPEGLRIAQAVPQEVAGRFDPHALDANTRAKTTPTGSTYALNFAWEGAVGETLGLALFGEGEDVLQIARQDAGHRISFHRAAREDIQGRGGFAADFAFDVETRGPIDVVAFVDDGLVEIGCCGGLYWMSNVYFPATPAGSARLTKRPA